MGVLRGRLLQPHGQSYFNDAALATLLAIGINIDSIATLRKRDRKLRIILIHPHLDHKVT